MAAHLGNPQGPHPRGAGRGARTVDGARPASPGAATSRRGGSCRTRRSSPPRWPTPRPSRSCTALPIFGGHKQRRSAQVWLDALEAARNNPEPPDTAEPPNGPPPAVRWAKRKPEAAARLEAARAALTELSATGARCRPRTWCRPNWCAGCAGTGADTADATAAVDEFLRDGGARTWQRDLVVPVLAPRRWSSKPPSLIGRAPQSICAVTSTRQAPRAPPPSR